MHSWYLIVKFTKKKKKKRYLIVTCAPLEVHDGDLTTCVAPTKDMQLFSHSCSCRQPFSLKTGKENVLAHVSYAQCCLDRRECSAGYFNEKGIKLGCGACNYCFYQNFQVYRIIEPLVIKALLFIEYFKKQNGLTLRSK